MIGMRGVALSDVQVSFPKPFKIAFSVILELRSRSAFAGVEAGAQKGTGACLRTQSWSMTELEHSLLVLLLPLALDPKPTIHIYSPHPRGCCGKWEEGIKPSLLLHW